MILDYDDEFTTKDGQAITATAIGTKVKDGNKAKDWAAGEPMFAIVRVPAAFNNLTSLTVDVIADTDPALATLPVVVATKTILLAALTLNSVHHIGSLIPGASKRYLGMKFTVTGTAPSTGKVIGFVTQTDQRPQDGIVNL
jgi:hypothetical protein